MSGSLQKQLPEALRGGAERKPQCAHRHMKHARSVFLTLKGLRAEIKTCFNKFPSKKRIPGRSGQNLGSWCQAFCCCENLFLDLPEENDL